MAGRMKRIGIAILIVLAISALGLFGFFKFVQHRIESRLTAPVLARQSIPTPDFTYRTLDGTVLHLAASHGKVVFLNLWGTWCVQCVAEMPTVQKLYDHYRGDSDVEFLIVSRLDSPRAVRSYAYRNKLNLPFYVTEDRDIPDSMQLNQYPSTFIYDRNGSIVAEHAGASNWSDESVVRFIDQIRAR